MLSGYDRALRTEYVCGSLVGDPYIVSACPTMENIASSINSFKGNISPGVDEISSELLKSGPQTSAEIILPIIRTFWESENLDNELTEGLVINISKKGDLTDPNNWQGITLICIINKVIAQTIAKRISDRLTPTLGINWMQTP